MNSEVGEDSNCMLACFEFCPFIEAMDWYKHVYVTFFGVDIDRMVYVYGDVGLLIEIGKNIHRWGFQKERVRYHQKNTIIVYVPSLWSQLEVFIELAWKHHDELKINFRIGTGQLKIS